MVGSLSVALAQKRFILAATDYFTNWVEAVAYSNVNEKDVRNFLQKNIVCRFEVSPSIISDISTQFKSKLIIESIVRLKIKHFFSSLRNS